MNTAPRLNLNGSSADELLDLRRKAFAALNTALDALRMMTPHGRDYQTTPPGTYENARMHHEARLQDVHAVKAEIEAEIHNILQQQMERRRWDET